MVSRWCHCLGLWIPDRTDFFHTHVSGKPHTQYRGSSLCPQSAPLERVHWHSSINIHKRRCPFAHDHVRRWHHRPPQILTVSPRRLRPPCLRRRPNAPVRRQPLALRINSPRFRGAPAAVFGIRFWGRAPTWSTVSPAFLRAAVGQASLAAVALAVPAIFWPVLGWGLALSFRYCVSVCLRGGRGGGGGGGVCCTIPAFAPRCGGGLEQSRRQETGIGTHRGEGRGCARVQAAGGGRRCGGAEKSLATCVESSGAAWTGGLQGLARRVQTDGTPGRAGPG